ncbi:nitrate- and nitrite sensing domain-containing protein [Streptomyces sp. A5-4]|uniref:sensor histidine kinase n=1 Tax=Streptomyces sp. A5-4 TaxID=3384771 RepID=UPI003DA9095E
MQKKRPRGGSGNGERTERTVRVRSRLVAGVAVVGVTVLAAGAPAIFHASSELSESQRLVTLSELNRQAVTLAHSLSDERDDVTAYIAAGREEGDADRVGGDAEAEGAESGANKTAKALSSSRSARVDRQLDEIEAAAPASLRRDLARIPGIRRDALTGEGTALEAHKTYTEAIQKLQDLAEELADRTPPRAAEATRAPAALGQAVEQAAATRGLLIAALSVPRENTGSRVDPITGLLVPIQESKTSESARTRNALSAAAQQSRVRELAALADFDQAAGAKSRQSLKTTVTGSEVRTAEQYLARLTDQPQLSTSELGTDRRKAEAALSARVDLMRGVESSLGSAQVQRLELLRDDDVTALEIRIALAGLLMIIAVGVSTAVARTLTQPLAVLRLGAARLAAEPKPASAEAEAADGPDAVEPIRFTGRNDEFAQVVRSLNTLHGRLAETGARAEKLAADRTHLIGQRESLAADRTALQKQAAEAAAQLERLRHTVHATFVNLSLRTLGVVERQLGVIEGLEEREQDPERLSTLFKLDHMATVMRRHGENLLVLAGTEQGPGHAGPVPLVDVLRAAVSEIERYERVDIQSLPPHSHVAGFAANDLSHLLAELLENATSFSPPDSKVQFSGWLLENGEVMLSVQDEGIGMPEARIAELNTRLADPVSHEPGEGTDGGIGLHVAALLAARHGVRVRLREQKQGGVAAVVVLPGALLPAIPSVAAPPSAKVAGGAPTLNLPGSVAEANSNALPGRSAPDTRTRPEAVGEDPLVAAAERTLREVAAVSLAEDGAKDGADAGVVTESAPVGEAPDAADTPDVPEPSGAEAGPRPVHGSTVLERDARARGERAAAAVFDRYAIGPDTHERVPDGNGAQDEPSAEEPTVEVPTVETPLAEEALIAGRPADEPQAVEPPVDEPPVDEPQAHQPPVDEPPAHEPPVDEPTWTMRLPKVPAEAADAAEDAVPTVIETVPAEPHSPAPETEVPSSAAASAPPKWERVTDKGLPKRTPKVLGSGPAEPAARTGSVDADALRRRLGGFQQGANEGRRDVEAEISSSSANGDRTETEGDTVEEARS